MAKKSIVTLGGVPGSGKSTVRDLLAARLGYTTFSTGDMMRKLAAERGMTLESLNSESSREKETDLLIDGKLMEIEDSGDLMIVDSILAHHFIPSAFHVFLNIALAESAKRIFEDRNSEMRVQSGDTYATVEEARAHIETRIQNHQSRYQKHYGLNPYDQTGYDLVIDTGQYTPEEVVTIIADTYQKWLNE